MHLFEIPGELERERRVRDLAGGKRQRLVLGLDMPAFGRPVRPHHAGIEIEEHAVGLGLDELGTRIRPHCEQRAGSGDAARFLIKRRGIEPVQRLRDRDEVHRGVGQPGTLGGRHRIFHARMRLGGGNLLRCHIGGEHFIEEFGERGAGLPAAATAVPDRVAGLDRLREPCEQCRRIARAEVRVLASDGGKRAALLTPPIVEAFAPFTQRLLTRATQRTPARCAAWPWRGPRRPAARPLRTPGSGTAGIPSHHRRC